MDQADRAAEAAASFFRAVSDSNWKSATETLSASSVAALAEFWRRELAIRREALSREKLASLNPDAPSEAIDYMASRARQANEDAQEHWTEQLPGFASRDEVISASDVSIALSFISSVQRRFGERFGVVRWRVIGAVLDGDETGYAAYELTSENRLDEDGTVRQFHSHVRLVRLVLEVGSWKVADPWVINQTSGVWNIVPTAPREL